MKADNFQREYVLYLDKVRIRNIQTALLLEIPLMPAGALLDYFVYPRNIVVFTEIRLLCTAIIAVALLLLKSQWRDVLYPALMHSWYILPCTSMAAMVALTNGAQSTYYAGFNLIALGASVVMQLSVTESLVTISIIYLLYIMGCVLNKEYLLRAVIVNNVYFITLTSLVVLIGNYYYNKSRFHEFVLRHELSRSQRQLEENNLQLRELDETKNRFFSNISHELRTPLTLIMGPIDRLKEELLIKVNPDLLQVVTIMESNALRLLRMINELLALVRLEKSQLELIDVTVEINSFLNGLKISVEHFAKVKGVQLKSIFKEPDVRVVLDRERLEKIVLNLLQNSIKFTRSGDFVSLEWQITESTLHLEVVDSGVGIAEENLPHIFDRFWQANTSSTRKQQGVGIGLALVKELTESMGGSIQVESILGEGSRFKLVIPFKTDDRKELQNELQSSFSQTEESGNDWLVALYRRADLFAEASPVHLPIEHSNLIRRKRPLILIAEDQADMAAFIGGQLNKEFDIVFAADGKYAVEMTRQFKPDLLILDVMMPEKDGFEVCRELKDEVLARGLPILVLTARADDATKLLSLTSGATDFLTKPFSILELQTRCRNLVALSVLSGRVTAQNQELKDKIDQIKMSEMRMVQHAKMVSLGRMSAGLIHEINNPLNYVLGALNQIKRRDKNSSIALCQDFFIDIEGGVKRVADLVSSLRTFSYPNPVAQEIIPLKRSLEEACRLTGCSKNLSLNIKINVSEEIKVFGNKTQLSQVWINVLQNAIDACGNLPDSSLITIKVEAETLGTKTKIRFCDNGCGIPENTLDKIFDPFFTTKDVGSGMGLGLSICQSIVESSGGWLDAESKVGQGTNIFVTLPNCSVEEDRKPKCSGGT